jgi:hypothetical protein
MLGDCYFLAALSALSEFPILIKQIFNQKKANPAGIYSLDFYIKG